jgi:hypothetical protein
MLAYAMDVISFRTTGLRCVHKLIPRLGSSGKQIIIVPRFAG